MAHEFLHGTDVGAGFDEMRGEAVAESVAGGGLLYAGGLNRAFHPSLDRFHVDVMAAPRPGSGITGRARRREQVLPTHFQMCPWILSLEGIWKLYTRIAVRLGVCVAFSHPLQLLAQRNAQSVWQDRHSILCALAIAYKDDFALDVDILDATATPRALEGRFRTANLR